MTITCAPDALYEQFIALLECAQEQNRERTEALTRQCQEAQREIGSIRHFEDFISDLRRKVEAGYMPAERALVELVPRKFNTSEFVGSLHEFSTRRAS